MEITFEIPQGYYTKRKLESYIQNSLSKIGNTPINAYSSTKWNITTPLKDIFFDNGNQKELKRRFEEQKELKRRQKEEMKWINKYNQH